MHMELFAGFIQKMKDTPDGDGSLLDHSMIVYGSGLSDGNRHTHEDLPVLMVGRGGGFRLGNHIVYPKDTPMTNLFLTLHAVGGNAGSAIPAGVHVIPIVAERARKRRGAIRRIWAARRRGRAGRGHDGARDRVVAVAHDHR